MEYKLTRALPPSTEITVIPKDGTTQRSDAATNRDAWQELYRTAMVEADPSKVLDRTAVALAAMARRQVELEQQDRYSTMEERWGISEARSSLEYWRELKIKSGDKTSSNGT
jgi:hypothetical protein